MTHLDRLFADIAEKLKTESFVAIDPEPMREAIHHDYGILIAAGYTDGIIPDTHKKAADHGIEWSTRLRHDLSTDIVFVKAGNWDLHEMPVRNM